MQRRRPKMKPLLDVNGAAEALAVSTWTIRAYIRDGKLQPVRIGRLVRLETSELERFVNEHVEKVDPNLKKEKEDGNQ
jgi:excisionase family DNA binding protein